MFKTILNGVIAGTFILGSCGVWADTPNAYDLQGEGIKISYSTTGLDGLPRLTYKKGKKTLQFSGDEIRTVDTGIGTLVTVTVALTVDTGSTLFSFLVPRVDMDFGETIDIKTLGITTTETFSTIPEGNHGQMETYSSKKLMGTARILVF